MAANQALQTQQQHRILVANENMVEASDTISCVSYYTCNSCLPSAPR